MIKQGVFHIHNYISALDIYIYSLSGGHMKSNTLYLLPVLMVKDYNINNAVKL